MGYLKIKFLLDIINPGVLRLGPDIDISSDVVGVKDPAQDFLRQAPSKPDLNQTCAHRALAFL